MSSIVLSAVNRAAAAGIVVVISAGNESAANPDGFALVTAQQGGNGDVIIAGAMDAGRGLTSYSNQAGSGAPYYLVALGDQVRTIDQHGIASLWSGTSFAAPVISGAAALLASAFPNLTGRQIVNLLLTTADDAGTAGQDSQYGNGILNIARAFQPQGTTTVAGTGVPVEQAGSGSASETMGDAAPKMTGVIILDGYSRAYVADFAERLRLAPRQHPLQQGLQANLSTSFASVGDTIVSLTTRRNLFGQARVGIERVGLTEKDARSAQAIAGYALSRLTPETAIAFGFSESGRTLQQRLAKEAGTPFLVARDPISRAGFSADTSVAMGLRQQVGPLGLSLTAERGRVEQPRLPLLAATRRQPRYDAISITADRRIGPADFSIGVTRLAEEQTVLGGTFDFTSSGATSHFLDSSVTFDLGRGWTGQAMYRRGWTSMPKNSGLVSGGKLSTDAWSIDLSRSNAFRNGDILAFRIMQPLRVRSGGYAINTPISYDYSDLSIGYQQRMFNLAPTGREIDAEAAYGLGLFDRTGYLGFNAFVRRQPGNIESMPADVGAAVRFSLRF